MAYTVEEVKAHLAGLADDLLHKLEKGERGEILAAQKAFTAAIEQVWVQLEHENASPRVKAIPRLIDRWAVAELPSLIQDPANDPKVMHELILFKNSLVLFE